VLAVIRFLTFLTLLSSLFYNNLRYSTSKMVSDKTKYSRREHTLLKKIHELCTMFDANAYLILARPDDGITVMNSCTSQNWPPADERLVQNPPILEYHM
jgi:homoserine acetyltransferase